METITPTLFFPLSFFLYFVGKHKTAPGSVVVQHCVVMFTPWKTLQLTRTGRVTHLLNEALSAGLHIKCFCGFVHSWFPSAVIAEKLSAAGASVTPCSDQSRLFLSTGTVSVSHNDVTEVRLELCDWLNWKNLEESVWSNDIPGHKFSNFSPFAVP